MLIIRPELPEDKDAIYTVNAQAFGREEEAKLVDAIRDSPEFIPALSLVAERDGQILGHVLFSGMAIDTGAATVPALSLAPVAVLPEYQRQGIGSRLIREGLDRSRALGHGLVILFGHPEYYPRFGFAPASRFKLKCEYDVPDEAFMALELKRGVLANASGVVRFLPEFKDAV